MKSIGKSQTPHSSLLPILEHMQRNNHKMHTQLLGKYTPAPKPIFILDCCKKQPSISYSEFTDKHLVSYFSSSKIIRHLQKERRVARSLDIQRRSHIPAPQPHTGGKHYQLEKEGAELVVSLQENVWAVKEAQFPAGAKEKISIGIQEADSFASDR